MDRRRFVAGVFALVPFGFLMASGQQGAKASYAKDVAPILKARCGSCHSGADAAAKLDLVTPSGLMKGGVSGKAVVPGDPNGSLLLTRLLGTGGKPRMPMGFPPLPDETIAKIRGWILEGAHLEGSAGPHWAYVKPKTATLPAVKDKSWVRNPIDSFVLARLETEGLKPSPEASKETLIRRVSLDVTGLPPTPEEIDAFLADKRKDAYERLVDRLLASPHYGERQARPWLDLARYADSDGYEKDLNRTAWKYRDWVIDAFNKNEPYDQFTIDQLAGDLLPFKGYDRLIATGFNRNTMLNREGGVDAAEQHFNVVLDRVNVTSTVWLGSTMQCARCHDHKYDPFTQKDYYRMSAFFGNSLILTEGSKATSDETYVEPQIPLPSGRQVAERTEIDSEIKSLESDLNRRTPETAAEFASWRAENATQVPWNVFTPNSAKSQEGATLVLRRDGSVLTTGKDPDQDDYLVKGTASLDGATSMRIEALTDPSLPQMGPGRESNFVLTKVELKVDGQPVPFASAAADFTQDGYDASKVIEGDLKSGWAIAGQRGRPHALVLRLAKPLHTSGPVAVEVVLQHRSRSPHHTLGCFRLAFTNSSSAEASVYPEEIQKLLRASTLERGDDQKLDAYFRQVSPRFAELRQKLSVVRAKMSDLQAQIPTAMILRDAPAKGPLTAWVRSRGEFLTKTEQVTAGTPAALPPMPSQLPRNRLGLAEWIVSKENPLTARVEVNRMWEQYFGRGIVETSEDFGTQGSKPTHPELLDWLATEFMRRDWDMKAMHRLIVTSATYRQSSEATPALVRRDPQNLLYARGPRFRMEAEMIRDQALVVGGIFDPKVGGPSVYPLQPDGVWNTPYNDQTWMTSKSGEQHRRGLYTFWKRSSPYAEFMAFDATSREECTVRRIRTNTPLQALAMLNDQAIFEAAQGLAKKMEKSGGSPGSHLEYGFRACTGRMPTQSEVSRLEKLLNLLKARYLNKPADAKKVAGTPIEAAYAVTANVLLNLDETLTKG